MTNEMPEIGTIFYSSWGYDQTNVDFYKVVAVGKSMVTLRKIGKRTVGEGNGYSDMLEPVTDFYFDEPFKRKVHVNGRTDQYRMAIRINSHRHAWLWDGTPKRQTASGWGH